MLADPDFEEYMSNYKSLYHGINYDGGIAGYFLRKSHAWAERAFNVDDHFEKVLEVGAGSGEHLKHVRHSFDGYWMTDLYLDRMNKNYKLADLKLTLPLLTNPPLS